MRNNSLLTGGERFLFLARLIFIIPTNQGQGTPISCRSNQKLGQGLDPLRMYGPGRVGSHLTFLASSQKTGNDSQFSAAWKEMARELTICAIGQKKEDEKVLFLQLPRHGVIISGYPRPLPWCRDNHPGSSSANVALSSTH